MKVAVISAVGKVELRTPFLNSGRPIPRMSIIFAQPYGIFSSEEMVLNDLIQTTHLGLHRVVGFDVDYAYWPESWSDRWGINELYYWQFEEYPEQEKYDSYKTEPTYFDIHKLDSTIYNLKALEGTKSGSPM